MALLLWLSGCAAQPGISARDAADANDTGAALTAKSETERQLLREVPSLPNGAERRIGGTAVVAEAPYTAASGRTCRVLRTGSGHSAEQDRLACSDGKSWFFVPNVFGDSLGTAGN